MAESMADRIRIAREAKGWSQEELARRAAPISVKTIQRIEQGKNVRDATLESLGTVLDLDAFYLRHGFRAGATLDRSTADEDPPTDQDELISRIVEETEIGASTPVSS
jgi:transcriptional regulator with XRE-family HTH domain